MNKKLFNSLLVLLLCLVLLISGCSSTNNTESVNNQNNTETNGQSKEENDEKSVSGKMTDVGTPREETLIVDILNGRSPNPELMNPYLPGCVSMDAGLHQLIFGHLWEVNTMTGEQFPDLAATMPEPLDDTMTKFRFKVREGLTWSDGVEFTAEDVEFTANMILNTKELAYHGYFASIVKSMKAIDKYTVEVETVNPEPKLAQKLGVVVWGNSFRIVPKHIWEKEDPTKFKFSDPVGVGPYKLIKRDPQGYWFLYEKREDWQNSNVGKIVGEPGPKYILFKFFGPEEKRIMAAINHELDVLQDITPESWEVLRKKNQYAKAWYDKFPYATMDDPCQRGMSFNCLRPPYDNPEIRWALALALDIKEVAMATFNGMLRVSPIQVPPIAVLQETYHKPMLDWLRDFQFSDGYKPFDESYAREIAEMLKQQGVEGLPSDEQELIDMFGVGWWKYDPDKATELLEKNGFKKENGKWLKPDGTPWQITINAPANFEVESMRLAFAVADGWRKFGIDASVRQMEHAAFWNAESTGDFEVGSYWPSCGLLPDVTVQLVGWHKQYVVPNGERAPGNTCRWKNDRVSQLLDELSALPSDDPAVVDKIKEVLKEFVKELPFLPMFGTSKFVPVDTYYWEGFPTSENPYEGPWWWWSLFKFHLPHIKPTGRK